MNTLKDLIKNLAEELAAILHQWQPVKIVRDSESNPVLIKYINNLKSIIIKIAWSLLTPPKYSSEMFKFGYF